MNETFFFGGLSQNSTTLKDHTYTKKAHPTIECANFYICVKIA